jgi:hypothetical protein
MSCASKLAHHGAVGTAQCRLRHAAQIQQDSGLGHLVADASPGTRHVVVQPRVHAIGRAISEETRSHPRHAGRHNEIDELLLVCRRDAVKRLVRSERTRASGRACCKGIVHVRNLRACQPEPCQPEACVFARASASLCAQALGDTERLVHRYIEVAPSPDGVYVADVEGDAPAAGREPMVRESGHPSRGHGRGTIIVTLPCGRARECWPSSLAWAPHTHQLSFALRRPGTHARSLYSVEADDGRLTQLLAFDGTITSLQYSRDGQLAMLATQAADKEVGATQAGASPAQTQIPLRMSSASPSCAISIGVGLAGRICTCTNTTGCPTRSASSALPPRRWRQPLVDRQAVSVRQRPRRRRACCTHPVTRASRLAEPRVSGDGHWVAFIGGLMSDFGSTGGDVFLVPSAGGPASNATRGQHASATSLGFDCQGHLLVKLLHDDHFEIVQFDPASPSSTPLLRWSGSASIAGHEAGLSLGCPSGLSATVQEDFTDGPEIQVGEIGHWRTALERQRRYEQHRAGAKYSLEKWRLRSARLAAAAGQLRSQTTDDHARARRPCRGQRAVVHRTGDQSGIARDRDTRCSCPIPRGSFGQGEAFTSGQCARLRSRGFA